ncbi:N-acetylglucosaminyldiphosphodolichol N-acetylglucosaminyltransferase [Malassezia caprae]|uniref:UDP-N-acetylglucosamine transferase subunit ALG14 n=1 Tax=Malassezia caprae TaxID=1381934 RepID=A0AAF0ECG7_9BASI|nr:N-acetylglucosaminyldiphosphodolichol N-acetylglucosaminyltransferase [Malassezia caprae]
MAILGSGGHTAEMLAMLQALPRDAYAPRLYVVSSGDTHSLAKARDIEGGQLAAHPLQALQIPRARRVQQSWASTPFSVAWSVLFSLWHLGILPLWRTRGQRPCADVLMMNGPATCVSVVAAMWAMRLLHLPTPRMLYVESVARVHSLSLSAKVLRHFVDQFIVQWPGADRTAAYYGILV